MSSTVPEARADGLSNVARSAAEPAYDDRLAARNALILSFAQACYGFCLSAIFNFGSYVGATLATDKTLATLPITTMMIGTCVSTIPASLFMQRYGRREGFLLGAFIGLVGTVIMIDAILAGRFWQFCLGTHCCGYYQSSAMYYRFAATDCASPRFQPKAISWTLGGGLLSALLTPEILTRTRELWVPFAACYVACSVAIILGMIAITFVNAPRLHERTVAMREPRTLWEIARQPRFLGALIVGIISYGMMNLVMTATPLAMAACSFSPDISTHTIRWHVLAMYGPSFFTGHLIDRFGKERMALVGLVLLAFCGVIALSGVSLMHFTLALSILGLGWNFGYISATSIVADSHRPEERGKTQALNDFSVFSFVAFTSYLSGRLLSDVGWSGLNIALFPCIGVAALLILILAILRRRAVAF
jgi:MFS family permease